MDTTTRSPGAIAPNRLEAFSDGVFAIATTLLIIEIKVPVVEGNHSLAGALLDLWPSYVAYALGFATIGVMWVNHHFLIGLITRIDKPLIFTNLALLGVVAFIPFPTAVLAEYLTEGSSANLRVAAIFYGVVMCALSVMFTSIWSHLRRTPDLSKDEQVSNVVATRALKFCGIGLVLYLLAIAVAFVLPALAVGMYGVVVILFAAGRLVPQSRTRR